MRLRNWTPRYAEDKLLLRLFEMRNPGAPWLTSQMVEILSGWLRPTDIGLEWGSGRSTVWFAARLAQLTSVENNRAWHTKVETMLREKNVRNVNLRLETNASDYVGVATSFDDDSVDFVLVDGGMARAQCARAALRILKPGAPLVIDNINWFLECNSRSPGTRKPGNSATESADLWDRFRSEVASWRHIWTTNGVTDTALWIKP